MVFPRAGKMIKKIKERHDKRTKKDNTQKH
jgi:hypothetical protein